MLYKIILIIAFSTSTFCFGNNPYKELLKKTGDLKEYPNANYITVFDSTNVEMQESGLSYYYKHVLVKILTDKGANQLSSVKFNYDEQSAYIKIEKVVIYRNDGAVEILADSLIYDYPAPSRGIYWGARQKILKLGRLQAGDAIEYATFKKGFSYALLQDEDDRYTPPMRGHFYDIVPFWSNQPIIVKNYRLTTPKSKNVKYEVFNGRLRVYKKEHEDVNVYEFTAKEILPFKSEPNMVAISDVAPKLLISTSPNWKAKSKWFYNINEDNNSFDSTPEVLEKVNELLKGAKDYQDSIAILTHWVADNMRYSGISMGHGEGYTLHDTKMNFTDRCGVCKDKASLLVAMLRAAGFEAYAAMTMAGSRIDPIPADQFNHSVAAVRMQDGTFQLLDPTWVPFVRELWSSAEQQQNYLIGTAEGCDLEETPISPPQKHYINITAKTKLDQNGTLSGKLELEAEGQSDAIFRRYFTSTYKTQWDNVIEKELLRVSPLLEIDSLNYGNPIDYTTPFKLFVQFTIPKYAFVSSSEIIFTPLLAKQLFGSRMSHLSIDTSLVDRKYPFRDQCSRMVQLKETLELPPYTKHLPIDQDINLEGTGAAFTNKISIKKRTLNFTQTAILKKRVYAVSDWPSVRFTVKSQNDLAHKSIILEK